MKFKTSIYTKFLSGFRVIMQERLKTGQKS
jgi:hypothetical protein